MLKIEVNVKNANVAVKSKKKFLETILKINFKK
jgi:hypothetical protein